MERSILMEGSFHIQLEVAMYTKFVSSLPKKKITASPIDIFPFETTCLMTEPIASTLIAISLADDWTNETVSLESISKPSGVPNLSGGGIWVDSENSVLYTGFAGRVSSFGERTSQPNGLWRFSPTSGSWANLNSTADAFTNNYIRPYNGLVASGNGKGYALGGE